MENCYRLRATFDNHFLARAHASHKRGDLIHRYRLPTDAELPRRAHGAGVRGACCLFFAMKGIVDTHAGKAAGCVESFIPDGNN